MDEGGGEGAWLEEETFHDCVYRDLYLSLANAILKETTDPGYWGKRIVNMTHQILDQRGMGGREQE